MSKSHFSFLLTSITMSYLILSFYLFIYLFIFFFKFIYLFMAVLGLRFRAKASSSCGKRGPLFIAVRGPLTIAASPVAEHRLQTRRLSNCGSRAQPPRGTRDPPRPGPKPASPAPAGRLPTTAPPGKPCHFIFNKFFPKYLKCVCLVGSIQLALVFLIQSDNL